MNATPDQDFAASNPCALHPNDPALLRQYHRIARIISSRYARNSARGGGSTARWILSHENGGFSHNTGTCRDVHKHISRLAHSDKNPKRGAYHCAVAEIVMNVAQRAADIGTSPPSSDRNAFPVVPALDLERFSTSVEAHRLAKQGRTPLARSTTPPSLGGECGDFGRYGMAPSCHAQS